MNQTKNTNYQEVKKKIFDCVNNVQKDCAYSRHVKTIQSCLVNFLEETIQTFKQMLLQLFSWQHKSTKLSRIYILIRRFFEDSMQDSYTIKINVETKEELELIKSNGIILAKALLSVACTATSSSVYQVKVRAACIIRIIFETCGTSDFVEDENVASELEHASLTLLRGIGNVKAIAIKLAPLFDNEGSKSSPWTWELIRIMGVCKTVEYRKAAIENIPISDFTLPYILLKTRDVSESVKRSVYLKLIKEEVWIADLKLKDRYDIILNGLLDRKEGVKKGCEDYLKASWVSQECNEIIIKRKTASDFLRIKSDVLESEEESNNVLLSGPERTIKFLRLFKVQLLKNDDEYSICLNPLVEFLICQCDQVELFNYLKTNVISMLMHTINSQENYRKQDFTDEGIVLFRITLEYFSRKKGAAENNLEDLLPDILNIDSLVRSYKSKLDTFVIQELLQILPYYNYKEPKINQVLVQLLENIILDVDLEDVLPKSSTASKKSDSLSISYGEEYDQLIRDQLDVHRRDIIVRNMSDIAWVACGILRIVMSDEDNRYEEYLKMRIDDFSVKIEEKRNKKGFPTSSQKSGKGQIEESQLDFIDESLYITRALKLAVTLLQFAKNNIGEETLKNINDKLIMPALQGEGNELIKFFATKYVGLCALMDSDKCIQLFPFLHDSIKGIATCQTLQNIAAFKAIFDCYLTHPKNLLQPSHTIKKNTEEQKLDEKSIHLLNELKLLFYCPNPRLRFLTFESFSKLLFCDKIKSPEEILVLMSLILADPSENETDVAAIKQIITLMFTNYTKLSLKRCKKLCNATVLFTLLWMKSNSQPGKVNENSILCRIMKCQFLTIASYLVFLMTHKHLSKNSYVNLEKEKESIIAELLIYIIKVITSHIDLMQYMQCTISICLRFIELDNMKPGLLLVLYKNWNDFINKAKNNEKEHYTFGFALKTRIQKIKESEEKEITDQKIKEISIEYEGKMLEIEQKFGQKLNKINTLSDRLYQNYNDLIIDNEQGCVKKTKTNKDYYQSGTLTDNKQVTGTHFKQRQRRTSRLETILETPRCFNGFKNSSSQSKKGLSKRKLDENPSN